MNSDSPKGPVFQTMFTLVSVAKDVDDEDVLIYSAETEEMSTIVTGFYKKTGVYAAQVVGPVGGSPCQYEGEEAQKVFDTIVALYK